MARRHGLGVPDPARRDDPARLARERVLTIADIVIPGHGAPFRVHG